MTMSLDDSLVGVGRTTIGTVTLDNPAPPGGVTVTLSLDTAIATVDPTAVSIVGGATEGNFVLTGVAVGTTTISGTSPVTETATAEVEVTDSLISIDDIPVIAPDESADLPVSITKPAPPGGVTIFLESLDPAIAITDPTTFIPEGLQVPATNPQITGVTPGVTQIKATAALFAPDTRDVTVALSVTLTPAELDIPELWTRQVSAQLSAPAPTGGVTLELSLDDPTLATVPAQRVHPGWSDAERADRHHRRAPRWGRRPSAPAAPASSRARQPSRHRDPGRLPVQESVLVLSVAADRGGGGSAGHGSGGVRGAAAGSGGRDRVGAGGVGCVVLGVAHRGRVGVAGRRDRLHQHLLDSSDVVLLRPGHDPG